jgi:flagellar hook-basal body complex protein FliE
MKVNPLGLSTYKVLAEKKAKPKDFFEVLLDKVKEVDAKEKEAEKAILDLLSGKEVDPVELSMKVSQADVSMKLLLRLRNKVLEAYQEIMRMQI